MGSLGHPRLLLFCVALFVSISPISNPPCSQHHKNGCLHLTLEKLLRHLPLTQVDGSLDRYLRFRVSDGESVHVGEDEVAGAVYVFTNSLTE